MNRLLWLMVLVCGARSISCLAAPDRATLERVAREAMGQRHGTVVLLDATSSRLIACSDPRLAFQTAGEPGSVFKVVTAAAALETHVTDAHARVECRPRMTAHESFLCTTLQGHGSLTITDALAQSCNVHFQELGRRLTAEALHHWARRFGFGAPTGLAPSGVAEVAGTLPQPASALQRAKQAIGQGGITATPAQVAQAYLRVSSGRAPDGPLCSPETLRLVRQGLRDAVVRGTARHAALSNLAVAGKTGTPEAAATGLARRAWFAGYAPADDRGGGVVIVVFLTGGRGGRDAAPVAQAVLRRYFAGD